MKLGEYLKDKTVPRLMFFTGGALIFMFMSAFRTNFGLTVSVLLIYSFVAVFRLVYDWLRKRKFYNELVGLSESMDKAYFAPQIINSPTFYEGKIVAESLGFMSKSMRDSVRKAEDEASGYKEYIEMWVHEVKVPLAALMLASSGRDNQKAKQQIGRIENYLEQALYYARSNAGTNDYIIAPVNLGKAVKNAALKNMSLITGRGIDFVRDGIETQVMSDGKWLEFIISQIISNRVKYKKDTENPYIKCSVEEDKDNVILHIYDNGMGIPRRDLPRVFDKAFTGYNGRKTASSTGMGLYIVKNLRTRLGIKIDITSAPGQYTDVRLTFGKNEWYSPVADIS